MTQEVADYTLEGIINLRKGKGEELLEIMRSEIEPACERWGVELTDEQRQHIIDNSVTQLINKVSGFSGSPWEFGGQVVYKLESPRRAGVRVNLRKLPEELRQDQIVKYSRGYKIDNDEPSSDAIPLRKVASWFEDNIDTWARTAVFYGVGSWA